VNTMTRQQSRFLALGMFVVSVALLFAALAWPWYAAFASQAAEIEHKEQQIAVYRSLVASEASMRQQLGILQRRNPAAGFFVTGDTPALASAGIQQYVKQIVDQSGGELISTQVVGGEDDEANSTKLSVHLRTDMSSLPQILYRLESGKPLLFLDELTISARLVRSAGAGAPPRVSLDLNFEVTGFLRESEG
jgi:general secretion pathway protein M